MMAPITSGPDGNLWFTEPTGMIGRLTPLGALTEFPVSTPEAEDADANQEANAGARKKLLLMSQP